MVSRASLRPRQQVLHLVQRGTRATAGRRRGQAYNLTAEESETSKEVITGKITVHSKLFLALFDFGASHCYISDSYTALYSIPVECLDNQWKISTSNGVVIFNRIYKNCTVELCNRKLSVDMLVLHTRGYDMILGMTWLSKYHAIIDCRNKIIIFKIPHQAKFQFDGEHKSAKERHR